MLIRTLARSSYAYAAVSGTAELVAGRRSVYRSRLSRLGSGPGWSLALAMRSGQRRWRRTGGPAGASTRSEAAGAGAGAGAGEAQGVGRLRALLAVVETAIDYAERLCHGEVDDEVHGRVEESLRHAIETAYLLGQLVAMPRLRQRGEDGRPAVPEGRSRRKLPLPGQPGFDREGTSAHRPG